MYLLDDHNGKELGVFHAKDLCGELLCFIFYLLPKIYVDKTCDVSVWISLSQNLKLAVVNHRTESAVNPNSDSAIDLWLP